MKEHMIVFIGLSIIPGIVTGIMIFTHTLLSGMLFAILLWVVPLGLTLFAYYGTKQNSKQQFPKEVSKN